MIQVIQKPILATKKKVVFWQNNTCPALDMLKKISKRYVE